VHAPTEQFPMGALAPAAPGKSAPMIAPSYTLQSTTII